MRSSTLRKTLIPASYAALIIASLTDDITPTLPQPMKIIFAVVGAAVFILSAALAVRVHSMFPRRHDRPEDFPHLLKEGPYRYCRHPFYLALILNQASIPVISLSVLGAAVFLATLPAWAYLIRIEEGELIRYWGREYLEYMEEVPALIPRLRRASDKAEHITD